MILLLLTGCAKTFNLCPKLDVKEYSKAERESAIKEMQGKQCPMLNSMMGDYLNLRDEARI